MTLTNNGGDQWIVLTTTGTYYSDGHGWRNANHLLDDVTYTGHRFMGIRENRTYQSETGAEWTEVPNQLSKDETDFQNGIGSDGQGTVVAWLVRQPVITTTSPASIKRLPIHENTYTRAL